MQCPTQERLQRYLDHYAGCSGHELDDHIESCSTCQEHLERLSAPLDGGLLGDPTPNEVPPSLMHRWVQRVETDANKVTFSPAADTAQVISHSAPRRLGDYEILREIGRGGMGVVYEARQVSLDRIVALKILPQTLFANRNTADRFRREARAASQLHHTNIVPVYEVGEDQGTLYYAMQLIDGIGLDNWVRQSNQRDEADISTDQNVTQTLPFRNQYKPEARAGEQQPDEITNSLTCASGLTASPTYHRTVAEIGTQICEALSHAHHRGVIHRDVKPSNLLLDQQGVAWLADFGLAKQTDDGLTGTMEAPGTLRYMSPERFQGQCDQRSDVYGLGVSLYELLAQQPLFRGNDHLALLKQIQNDQPTALREIDPEIPRDLQTIVAKAMEKDAARRYATADEFGQDLRRFLDGEPIRARRVSLAERVWLWAKKERALATSLAAVFLLLVTAAMGSIFAAQQQAQLATEKAAETKEATKQRDEARQNAYFADIRQAYQDWENGQTRRMLTTLRAYLPVEGRLDVRGWEWYYLLHLAHNHVTTLTDFDGVATQVAWTPNDQRLVSAHSDGSLRFWDRSGKPILKIPIPSLAQFSINQAGDRVVTASSDSLLRFWDVETGKLVRTLKTDFSELQAVDWHEGTQQLAIAGKRITVGEGQPDKLVGGSAVISARDGDVIWRQDAYPFQIKFSPDGSRAVELSGGKFRVVELNGPPRETAIVPFRDFQPKCVSWFPDNRRFVIGCFLHPSCLMEAGDEGVQQIGRFSEQTIDAVVVSRNGERIFAGNRGQRIDLMDVTNTDVKRLKSLRGHLGPPVSVAIDSQEKLLASASQDGSIRIWDLSGPEKAGEPVSFGQSPDGRWRWHTEGSSEVAITDSLDRDAKKIVFARNPVEVKAKFFPKVSRALFWDVSWAGCPYRVAIFDTDAGRIVDYWLANNARPPWASVSCDFATMSTNDGGIMFFDGRTGHIRSIALHAGSDFACAGLSPDGKKIASCLNGEVKVWDAATTTEEATMFGQRPGGFMPWLCWGNTNRFFATASVDRTIVIWDAYEKRAHQTLHGLQGMPQLGQFGFLLDDRRFTARDGENQKVWDVGTGREILSVPNGTEAERLFERSTSVREIRDWCLLPEELQFSFLRKAESVAKNQTTVDAYARKATHLMARKVLDASNWYFSPERGLKLSTQALDRNPTNADCLWTHCVAQYRNGLYASALATLGMANDSGFDSVTADFVRADCLHKTGERDESKRVLAAAEQRLTKISDIQAADLFLIRDVVVSYFDQERPQRDEKKIVVNTLRDELDASNQETSLREAVCLAAEGAEITIRVTGTMALRYGPIRVAKSMTIAGPGYGKLTISGQDKTQIFEIDDNIPSNDSHVTLRGLRCTEGRCTDRRSAGTGWGGSGTQWAAHGGGAIFSTESLLVEDCEFRRNTSEFGGGAVSSDGGLESTFLRCSFARNSAKVGGAVHLHTSKARIASCTFEANQTFSLSSAVNHCGNSMVIVNSTFVDNVDRSSTPAWGAVLAHTSKVSIDHCTFTRNMGGAIVMTYHPTYWSKLEVGKDFAGPSLTVANSILFGNMDRNDIPLDLQKNKGLTCTFRNCIIGTLPAGMVSKDDNLLGVDPKLGPLADNGGPTKTIGLVPGSPAIDAADSQIEFDQRGQVRVGAPDIGAVEFSQAK